MAETHPGPVAVLVALDGEERVIPVSGPPMLEYLVPQRVPMHVSFSKEPSLEPLDLNCLVFRLAPFRSRNHRFRRVYNHGQPDTRAPVRVP